MSGTYTPGGEGPPIENKAQLIAHLASGEKPRESWRIGTEHEKFGFSLDGHRPLAYDGDGPTVRKMLEGLTRFGWNVIEEDGKPVALKRDGASVTLEPGGQFELSGAPLDNLHETCREANGHLGEVRERHVWQPIPKEVRARFRTPLPTGPQPLGDVYEELRTNTLPYAMGNIHPRFWGWYMGSGNFTGALGDFLAAIDGSTRSGRGIPG